MNIISTTVAVLAIASGSAMANNGPAPLSLSQLDTVSAGASAGAYGSTHAYVGKYGVKIDNKTGSTANGKISEIVYADQSTLVHVSTGYYGLNIDAYGMTSSGGAAISYGGHKRGHKRRAPRKLAF